MWHVRADAEDEEAEPEELVDRNLSCCKKCCNPRSCFLNLLRAQNRVFSFVTDPLFDLFIIVMIVCNSVILCLYWHGMSDTQQIVLDQLNNAFTGVFGIEAILKIFGMSIWYFKNPWNIFDLMCARLLYCPIRSDTYTVIYTVLDRLTHSTHSNRIHIIHKYTNSQDNHVYKELRY